MKRVTAVALAATMGVSLIAASVTVTTEQSIAAPKNRGSANTTSIPAAGNTATGVFLTYAPGREGTSRTKMELPPTAGAPLLADWNGDGVATPGRYLDGIWWITNASVDSPTWQEYAQFGGQPGDIPVVGDRDGNGSLEIGVFNNGLWTWRTQDAAATATQPTTPPANPPITFGQPGDVPVVGDWDGNGTTDLGVFRLGLWQMQFPPGDKPKFLNDKTPFDPEPNAATNIASINFGSPTAIPVAGDWDGDGRETPAVVSGTRWILIDSLAKPKKTTKLGIELPAGSTPLVGSRIGGLDTCPTQTLASRNAGDNLRKAVSKPVVPNGNRSIEGNREIALTLEDGVAYSIRNDSGKRLANRSYMSFYDPISTKKTMEESIRRNANVALAAATLLSTTNLNEFDGIKRTRVLDYARWHIRSIACQHGSNSVGGWGANWQSALWSTTTAQAAWLIWKDLSADDQGAVVNMVVSEANAVAQRGPRYFRDRAGKELSPGNSQSDEVSWDMLAPTIALAMLPSAPQEQTWRKSAIAHAIAAFSRPGDLTSDRVTNGVAVGSALPGTNANEDGTVTNHGRVNPDYTQNVQHLWWAATLLRAAKIPVPEAFFYNADIVYRALSVVEFPSPPYAAPGGTVYKPLGQIYYPMGVSWGVRRPATFVGVDGFANVYSAPDTRAGDFLAAHARDTRALQLRFTDGRIYADGNTEDSYRLGKEEYALQQLALAWWAGSWKFGPKMNLDTKSYSDIRLDRGY